MLPEELGGYFRLLLVAWQRDEPGYLPNDTAKLASWSRLGRRWSKHSAPILACFRATPDGRFYQKRMVEVARVQETYRENQRLKGVASGLARKNRTRTASEPDTQPDANRGSTGAEPDTQPEGNSASASASESKRKKKHVQPKVGPTRFDSLYERYPRHEGRLAGMEAFEKSIRTDEDFERLTKAVDAYAAKIAREKPEKRHVLLWSTFANGRWLDYVPTLTIAVSNGEPRRLTFAERSALRDEEEDRLRDLRNGGAP